MDLTVAEKEIMLRLLRKSKDYSNGGYVATILVEKIELSLDGKLAHPGGHTVKELEEWIVRNHEHLSGYTAEEVAQLAIAVGFPKTVVSQWQIMRQFKKVI